VVKIKNKIMLKLEVIKEVPLKVSDKFFKDIVKKLQKVMKKQIDEYLPKKHGLIDLVLVDDERIQDLNREYREEDNPTDVIAFAYLEVTEFEEEEGDIIAGDIFISIDTAKKQAKKHKHSLEKEMEMLFVHGLLHLFGYDHKNDKEEKEMEKWALKVLS
jgi:probable rRNA maturation factor